MMTFWAFSTLPSRFFCTSELDPCSCTGGGFEIFNKFCEAAATSSSSMSTMNSSNTTGNNKTKAGGSKDEALATAKTAAQGEYVGIFESLGRFFQRIERSKRKRTQNSHRHRSRVTVAAHPPDSCGTEGSSTTIIVTVVVIFVIALVFGVARSQLFAAQAEREKDEIEVQRLELLEQNKSIQAELALNALNEEQAEIVHAGTAALEAVVPLRFQIPSKNITFEKLLGSGSFGDCYKGHFHNIKVAVKQMRVGLVNEDGFNAYAKEVAMLAAVDHENIVTFTGYSLEPTLLIVMEFVEGGTLSDYLAAQNPEDPVC